MVVVVASLGDSILKKMYISKTKKYISNKTEVTDFIIEVKHQLIINLKIFHRKYIRNGNFWFAKTKYERTSLHMQTQYTLASYN